ncbi:hypothetical protein [Frankia sp. QA3]|uniref:hypothetical protein n=1 Tax=Frankia sp. QA3 TaxID=710111 RepID=UPI0002E3EAD8|nr:hypothetical protein [Frankia sp. QA3]
MLGDHHEQAARLIGIDDNTPIDLNEPARRAPTEIDERVGVQVTASDGLPDRHIEDLASADRGVCRSRSSIHPTGQRTEGRPGDLRVGQVP